jgi:hypothetical protein
MICPYEGVPGSRVPLMGGLYGASNEEMRRQAGRQGGRAKDWTCRADSVWGFEG